MNRTFGRGAASAGSRRAATRAVVPTAVPRNSRRLTLRTMDEMLARARGLHEPREIESAALGEQRLPEIAELLDARRHIPHREVFDANALPDFLPRHRRRDGRVRPRARRINRRERAAPAILVVVDEDAPARAFRHAVL